MIDPLAWHREGSRYGDPLILFKTRFDQLRHPGSGRSFERLILESVDWVNCVAIDTEGRLVMVRQFRFGSACTTLETPGGMVDAGEDSETAARRELLEETGFAGGAWRYLGAVQPNPAIHDNLCHHWLGTEVVPVAEPRNEGGEFIRVELQTPAEMLAAVHAGEIQHALALSVLSRVYNLWGTPGV
jgi:ADP-ribose pyrophosphatase